MTGRSPSGRAGRAAHEAPAGLHHAATIPNATLLELAERCEKAAGPDRSLDAMIYCAEKGCQFIRIKGDLVQYEADGNAFSSSYRPYTASLDAAMALVPEGWFWTGGRSREGRGAMAVVSQDETIVPAVAATPALALCAAALRARSAQ